MVTTVFGFGNYAKTDPKQVPIHGKTLEAQYATNQALVYIAIILIFFMLCTKPCMVKFGSKHQVHEENQIEFSQINQINDEDKPSSINVDANASGEDLMQRR